MLFRWLKSQLKKSSPVSGIARKRLKPTFRAILEALEDRCVPTTYTWTGAVNGNWSNAGNWLEGKPSNGSDLYFPADAKTKITRNDNALVAVHSISLLGGYTVQGNNLSLDPGGIGNAGTNEIQLDFQLTGGTLALPADHSINVGNGTLTLRNIISGDTSNSLSKVGTGTLIMAGASGNSYRGNTTVIDGNLVLSKSNNVIAVPGSLFISSIQPSLDGDQTSPTVTLKANEQIANSAAIVQYSSTFNLNGFNESIGSLTLNYATNAFGYTVPNGNVVSTRSASGVGVLTLTGNVTTNGNPEWPAAFHMIDGNVSLGTATRTFTVGHGKDATQDLVIKGAISGASGVGLTFAGDGVVEFQGVQPNTYTGPTTVVTLLKLNKSPNTVAVAGPLVINGGSVQLLAAEQIANTASVTINSGTSLNLKNNNETIGPLTMNGGSIGTGTATLTLNDNVTASANPDGSPARIGTGVSGVFNVGAISLGSAGARTFKVAGTSHADPAAADLFFEIKVTGSAGMTKTGPGTLMLYGSGTTGNSFTGVTTVNQGVLVLDSPTNTPAIGRDLVVDSTAGGPSIARWFGNNHLSPNAILTVKGAKASIEFIGSVNEVVNSISLTDGALNLATGQLYITGDVTASSAGTVQAAKINGSIVLANTTQKSNRTFNVKTGQLIINGTIFGTPTMNGLTKTGPGYLSMTSPTSNSYLGSTIVQEGVLELAGTGSSVPRDLTIGVPGGKPARVSSFVAGSIDASSNVTINSPGTLVLGHGNTITSLSTFGPPTHPDTGVSVSVLDGSLTIQGNLAMTGGQLATSGTGFITLNGNVTASAGPQSPAVITGRLVLGGPTKPFTINPGGAAGDAMRIDAVISGGTGMQKLGTGVLRLTGKNTYTGVSLVTKGVLAVDGQQPSSPVQLDGGTLGGHGVIGTLTATANGGTISPGLGSTAILSITGNVTLNSAVTLVLNMQGTGTVPGKNFGQLNVTGNVALNNAKLNLTPLSSFVSPAVGTSLLLIPTTGTVTGVFSKWQSGSLHPILFKGRTLAFDITYGENAGEGVEVTYYGTLGI
ncbi:MAG: autotransporter-associated beta strand repeat-containing protein [Gemmatales bacterium]